MARSEITSNTSEEILYISKNLIKILFLTCFVSIISSFLICSSSATEICFFKSFLFIFGLLNFFVGLFLSCYFSSFALGFDAIWTPQLQGEIQRDERERQISGWPRAFTGGLIFILGIITLYTYIDIFVI